jgi:uncharacterized membrane protein YesL
MSSNFVGHSPHLRVSFHMHYAYKRAFESVNLLGYVFGWSFHVSYLLVLYVNKCYIPHFTNLALSISIFLFGLDVFSRELLASFPYRELYIFFDVILSISH